MQATCCVSSLSLSLTSPESSCVPQTGPQLCPHIWLEMSTYGHEIFQPRTSLEVFLFTDNLLWCTEGLMRLAKWQISQGTLLSLWCNSHLARFRESRGSFHGCAGDCRFQKRFIRWYSSEPSLPSPKPCTEERGRVFLALTYSWFPH